MEEKKSLDSSSKHVQVQLTKVRPDARYANDLYDEYGNLVLEAHQPLTQGIISHLLSQNTEFLYYDPTTAGGEIVESDSGLNVKKQIVSDGLKQKFVNQSKNILEHNIF